MEAGASEHDYMERSLVGGLKRGAANVGKTRVRKGVRGSSFISPVTIAANHYSPGQA